MQAWTYWPLKLFTLSGPALAAGTGERETMWHRGMCGYGGAVDMYLKALSPPPARYRDSGAARRTRSHTARRPTGLSTRWTVKQRTHTTQFLSRHQCLHQFHTSVIISVICAIKKFSSGSQFDSADKRYTFIYMKFIDVVENIKDKP